MPASARPLAAIFDLDGTIVDSEPGSQAALRQLFGQYAVPCTEELIAQFVGRRGAEVFAELDLFPGRDPAELAAEVGRLHRAMNLPAALPFPGAVRLLREIHLAGDPLGLVTSGGRWYAVPRLEQLGLLELFAVIVTADDVAAGKPDPQGYLRACREMGVAAPFCVVFEDSPAGVAAAKAAGLYCVAVTTTHRASQLGRADRVVADLAEVSWPLTVAHFRLPVPRRPARVPDPVYRPPEHVAQRPGCRCRVPRGHGR
jgi:beta-phosphoglucomutase-like phosphatase (HAD superfamily)